MLMPGNIVRCRSYGDIDLLVVRRFEIRGVAFCEVESNLTVEQARRLDKMFGGSHYTSTMKIQGMNFAEADLMFVI